MLPVEIFQIRREACQARNISQPTVDLHVVIKGAGSHLDGQGNIISCRAQPLNNFTIGFQSLADTCAATLPAEFRKSSGRNAVSPSSAR